VAVAQVPEGVPDGAVGVGRRAGAIGPPVGTAAQGDRHYLTDLKMGGQRILIRPE